MAVSKIKTKDQIYKIIASVLDMKISDIKPSLAWEESDTDSFALVELVVALQEHFKIRLDSSELNKIKNVQDMVMVIESKVKRY